MGEALVARYFCHMCSQMVSPVMDAEIKCPFYDSGFVEEMDGREEMEDPDLGSDRSHSLWPPILLGMMEGSRLRRHRSRRDDDDEDSDDEAGFRAVLHRRRRSSAILQLLQGLGEDPRSDNPENERRRERDSESLVLLNAFNQAVILQGSFDPDQNEGMDSNSTHAGASLGDYFVGPGLDLLLQYLAENDPNRYGTPPAKKEVVQALPTVKIDRSISCSVCLEDFYVGMEAKEMPCQHKFHSGCILPWLELHSSCPVCRFQLPADESNGSVDGARVEGDSGSRADGGARGNESRLWLLSHGPSTGCSLCQVHRAVGIHPQLLHHQDLATTLMPMRTEYSPSVAIFFPSFHVFMRSSCI